MNGELADLLADRSRSEQVLLELEEANAFGVSLDAQRTWFRYHRLLADFLRLELRRTLAGEIPRLHRRAALAPSRACTYRPIQVLAAHHGGHQNARVPPGLYTIRIRGRLGARALSAFPALASELNGDETVLTGFIEDRSALFGVLAQLRRALSRAA